MNLKTSRICALAAALMTSSAALAQEASNNRVAAETDWSVFVETDPEECWAVSAPKETVNTRDGNVVEVRRGDIRLIVFYRPSENVRGQVMFTGGYPFREGSTVSVQIGDVTYEISGPLIDPLSCHCSRCRKAFSSQSSNYARVDASHFKWTSGEHLLSSYVGREGFGLAFCSVCGSTLCGTFDGVVHGIVLGCLNDDPELDEIHHIYVGSKASWEVLPDGVTTFPEGREPADQR